MILGVHPCLTVRARGVSFQKAAWGEHPMVFDKHPVKMSSMAAKLVFYFGDAGGEMRPEQPNSRRRILVAEDDADVCGLTAEVLRHAKLHSFQKLPGLVKNVPARMARADDGIPLPPLPPEPPLPPLPQLVRKVENAGLMG